MWHDYFIPKTIEETIRLLSEHQGHARLVAGATDLILEMERGVRKNVEVLIDITRLSGLDQIELDDQDIFHLGALVTHNAAVASELVRTRAYPLARA